MSYTLVLYTVCENVCRSCIWPMVHQIPRQCWPGRSTTQRAMGVIAETITMQNHRPPDQWSTECCRQHAPDIRNIRLEATTTAKMLAKPIPKCTRFDHRMHRAQAHMLSPFWGAVLQVWRYTMSSPCAALVTAAAACIDASHTGLRLSPCLGSLCSVFLAQGCDRRIKPKAECEYWTMMHAGEFMRAWTLAALAANHPMPAQFRCRWYRRLPQVHRLWQSVLFVSFLVVLFWQGNFSERLACSPLMTTRQHIAHGVGQAQCL